MRIPLKLHAQKEYTGSLKGADLILMLASVDLSRTVIRRLKGA
jgi:hypothetical protein